MSDAPPPYGAPGHPQQPYNGHPPPPPQGYYPPPPHGYYPPPPMQQQQTSNNVVVVSQPAASNTVIVKERGVNHPLHCIITLFCPIWIFVWIILCITDGC